MGQGIVPEQYHPVVDVMGKDELERFLATIKSRVDTAVSKLPEHDAYIDQYCRAAK
jgi:tryptophan halogenase